jgi:methylmalonyl-CoA mutase N-terminal domain/subunit
MLRFHTQVAGVTLTAQQPMNNIARVTIQALAAVCGGTQSLHTNSYDEALGLPTEESATVALRTQQIIAEESGAANVADPLGGSYLVEMLTDEIYDQARSKITEIEEMGGAMKAIEAGFQQREIHEAAWKHLMQVESGDRKIVGVNHGVLAEEAMPPVLKPDPNLGLRQRDKLDKIRANRNNDSVSKSLQEIRESATSDTNLFPLVIEALKHDCTLGEIVSAMKDVFGTWMPPSGF